MALFDEEFRQRMQPNEVRIVKEKVLDLPSEGAEVNEDDDVLKQTYNIRVEFEHAEAVRDIFTKNDFSHLYTVKITPSTDHSQISSIRIGQDGKPKKGLR